jgi:magnesium-transporting ATPase (P-type)
MNHPNHFQNSVIGVALITLLHVVTGAELEAASDDAWHRLVSDHDIFGRTSPVRVRRLA